MGQLLFRRRIMVTDGGEKDYVDLGLPSGMLWAKGNLVKDGTTGEYSIGEETDNDTHFAWGDITGYNASDGHAFSKANYNATTVNGTLIKNISTDILPNSGFDAVRVNLGGSWRMPTDIEFQELADNTTRTWETINGKTGYKFTANNGNYIFIPINGVYVGSNRLTNPNNGYYWQSTIYASDATNKADYCDFGSSFFNPQSNYYGGRYYGMGIRPVQLPHQDITIALNPTDGTSASGIPKGWTTIDYSE